MTNFVLIAILVAWIAVDHWRIRRLESLAHPPLDLTPAMVDVLKSLKVICNRPPAGWWCSRPSGHHGACVDHQL